MNELLRLLPDIQRTRGNRLYADDGRRFLDLWMDGGRGILGDRDKASRTMAANAADKGLVQPYPGLYRRRFERAVLEAWPALASVRLFLSEERALEAASRIVGGAPSLLDAIRREGAEPVGPGPAALALLRPFTGMPEGVRLALPRLPCPRPFAPACLAATDAGLLAGLEDDLVPGLSLMAAARGLASLATASSAGYDETHWKRFDRRMAEHFERRGPYLFARGDRAGYGEFFRAALAGGALVSPDFDQPSIVPPDFDDGELKKLSAALRSIQPGA